METLRLQVNGQNYEVEADAKKSLLSVLRDDLGLTGCKYGCGESECGACTVLVDGRSRRSCVLEIGKAVGREITTIEGLGSPEELHPVQQAFLDHGAMQCGYCTPGMILSAVALLDQTGDPSDAEILRHMNGNLCRCGTYPRIFAAIRSAAGQAGGSGR